MASRRPRRSVQQKAIERTAIYRSAPKGALYETNPGPQNEFMLSEAEELLYGGAAGGGKSFALRAFATNYCMTYPGAQGVLFRRTYRELEDTHIIAIQQEIPSSIATYHTARHDLVFNATGSVLMFRFCEGDEEARTYDTTEFDFMLFDELTSFTQFQYQYLIHRCRSTKPWWPGRRLRSCATPLGIGHSWVKNRWITPPDAVPREIWRAPASEGGMTRQFIPAKITDNPVLMQSDPDYLAFLRTLPEEEYRAKALGDWSVFTGQFFRKWDPTIHVVPPFDIPADWDRFIAVDYGFSAPYAAYWLARPPSSDRAFVYREHYGSGIEANEQAYRAAQVSRDYGEKLRAVILDPSMFGKSNVKGIRVAPISDDWMNYFKPVPVVRGNNDRVPGWSLFRQMLEWTPRPDGGVLIPPKLFVFSECKNLIRTIPELITDEHNPEDIDSDGEDHAVDALRYGLMHVFRGPGNGTGLASRYVIRPGRGLVATRG